MRDESPDRDRSGNSVLFKQCFAVIAISIYIETVDFILISRYVETLKSAFWSCFLIERHDHLLKIARLVMSSLEFCISESNSHFVYNPVGISCHIKKG